jgi:large conductance mechanosensitive channel
MKGFINFVREQGVVGLAVGFILGGSVSKVVTSLVNDIINPLLGIVLGRAGDLKNYSLVVGKANIMWGSFVAGVIDFMIISAVVYFAVKGLKLDKLDKKKS